MPGFWMYFMITHENQSKAALKEYSVKTFKETCILNEELEVNVQNHESKCHS